MNITQYAKLIQHYPHVRLHDLCLCDKLSLYLSSVLCVSVGKGNYYLMLNYPITSTLLPALDKEKHTILFDVSFIARYRNIFFFFCNFSNLVSGLCKCKHSWNVLPLHFVRRILEYGSVIRPTSRKIYIPQHREF